MRYSSNCLFPNLKKKKRRIRFLFDAGSKSILLRSFRLQDISDISREVGESCENNRWQPSKAVGRHRNDIQRVPEHSYIGGATCGDSGANSGRSESLSVPDRLVGSQFHHT